MSHVEAASLAVEPRRGSWNQRWVTLELSNQPFAIPVEHCQDIVMLSPLSCRPNPLPFERGMMRLRERVLPALDLRKRLGMCSFVDELDELEAVLEAREQDHINWLNELEKSVEEGRPFTLTTDPNACAFGRWYNSFRTDCAVLRMCLEKFDEPHKAIHATAVTIEHHKEHSELEEARMEVRHARLGVLSRLRELFAEARALLRQELREVAVVVRHEDMVMALIADAASEIVGFEKSEIQRPTGLGSSDPALVGVVTHDPLLFVLDVPALFRQAGALA